MKELHEENMWCFHCEKEWVESDYFNVKKCPNCKKKPIRIYRTSSTSFVYAHMEKHPIDIEAWIKKVNLERICYLI